MMDDIRVPIYLVTGFLESGKTTFLDFTLQQEYFAIDGKTLLILCEEGEEEYDMDKLKLTNTVVEVIEDQEDLTPQRLAAMDIIHQPERVVIEYNGMWLVSKFEQMELPEGWGIEQEITCVDATTYQVYMANMKSLFMDMIRNTDMVVFNRCKEGDPLPAYRRGIKVANQGAEVIFVVLPAFAHAYVAQQLAAKGYDLYYWESSSTAELDFVLQKGNQIIGIEVKKGEHVRSRSLSVFVDSYKPAYSIRLSLKNFGEKDGLKSVPLYAAFCI